MKGLIELKSNASSHCCFGCFRTIQPSLYHAERESESESESERKSEREKEREKERDRKKIDR